MGVYKLSANSVKNGRTIYGSMLAGNTAYVFPTDFESIATQQVTSGSQTFLDFTSIPSTYTHLQLRCYAVSTSGTYMRVGSGNTLDTAANYYKATMNFVSGNAQAVGYTGQDQVNISGWQRNPTTTYPLTATVDILDYKNTNKNKSFRMFAGFDTNSDGEVSHNSGLWMSTNAINIIRVYPAGGGDTFQPGTIFGLYGIRSA